MDISDVRVCNVDMEIITMTTVTNKQQDKIERFKNAPFLSIGKYKGKRITEVPMSYLRWILSQKFPAEIMDFAREKVSENPTSNINMDITRHAYDSFSLRYLGKWQQYNIGRLGKMVGIGSYISMIAQEAFDTGEDISKTRHQDEELIKKYQDMKFVFNRDGEVKVCITIM